jgi:hypothetical protein
MNPRFDHEKLNVYQASFKFVAWATELITGIQAKAAVKERIGEGAGEYLSFREQEQE